MNALSQTDEVAQKCVGLLFDLIIRLIESHDCKSIEEALVYRGGKVSELDGDFVEFGCHLQFDFTHL
jgi:hypothetical protein